MPTFVKQIVPKPGKYLARAPDGKRVLVDVTLDRMRKWITNFKTLLGRGFSTPAPWWKHEPGAVPTNSPDKGPTYKNGGFWKNLWLEGSSLYGEIDVPDHQAADIGTSVREVSPLAVAAYRDGVGNEYDDTLVHIALITKPVIPGQDNFQPSQGASTTGDMPQVAFSASDIVTGFAVSEGVEGGHVTPEKVYATNPGAEQVLQALASVGLNLPADTTPENLAERIIIAAHAKAGSREEGEGEEEGEGQGQNVQEKPTPIVMSLDEGEDGMATATLTLDTKFGNKAGDGALFSESGKTNPNVSNEQGIPGQGTSYENKNPDPKVEALKKRLVQAVGFASAQVQEGYVFRIRKLIQDGHVDPAYAEKELRPMIEAYQFSLGEDGKPKKSAIDVVLDALEAHPAPVQSGLLMGVQTNRSVQGPDPTLFSVEEQKQPKSLFSSPTEDATGQGMSDEDSDKISDTILESAGLKEPAKS